MDIVAGGIDGLGLFIVGMHLLTENLKTLASRQLRRAVSIDAVLLSLVDAMDAGDVLSWQIARQLTGDRDEMMRKVRAHYLENEPPLGSVEVVNVLLTTNAVEEIVFVFSKIEAEYNVHGGSRDFVPTA